MRGGRRETRRARPGKDAVIKRIETLSEFLVVWRSLVERVRLDFTIGRRLASDPTGTLRQYGYDVGPEVQSALLRVFG